MKKKTVSRAQLISTWGIGQVINFPNDESLMVAGLDAWEYIYRAGRDGVSEWRISESRLQTRLGVTHFRLPPEFRENKRGVRNPGLTVPCVRFPQWHYCPRCGAMEKLSIHGLSQTCSGPSFGDSSINCMNLRRSPHLIPVRIVAICQHGHIEDFPFLEWVHWKSPAGPTCRLRMRGGRGSQSLAGIEISCSCGEKRTLAGAFQTGSIDDIKLCSGLRPWLGNSSEHCSASLNVVQRGASNVYFPLVRTSLYIPNEESASDERLQVILDRNWTFLTSAMVDGQLDRTRFELLAAQNNVDCQKLLDAAFHRISPTRNNLQMDDMDEEESYRSTEYDAIINCLGSSEQDFYVSGFDILEYGPVLSKFFQNIRLLHKLRETRALAGFTRIVPEDTKSIREHRQQLSLGEIDWLPAVVVRGEGIFFQINEMLLDTWLEREEVIRRTDQLIGNLQASRFARGLPNQPVSPKYFLIHTLAHVLINQLIFTSGYGASSLRERIYCNNKNPEKPMSGFLIYTASGDSEGSMGGLVRLGKPGNLETELEEALIKAQWCSSDPICMESRGQGPDSCNLAACHSCALLPETSCETGNRLLDRALLVGTLDQPLAGFFYELIR